MNKVRGLLQAVGFLTLALLAIYGALAFAGGAGPLPGALSARAQEALPNAEVTAPEFVTGTVVSASPDGGALAPTVNYQGIIRLADGSFPPPGTTYDITARVYTNTVAPVAKAIYTTKKTGVSIRDGVFNIVLGDEPALPADAFSTAPRYVGIELGAGDGTHELIPRQRVHSVPWAMTASTLVQNAQVGDFGAQYIKAKGVDAADYVATKYVQTPGLTVMTNPPGGTGKL